MNSLNADVNNINNPNKYRWSDIGTPYYQNMYYRLPANGEGHANGGAAAGTTGAGSQTNPMLAPQFSFQYNDSQGLGDGFTHASMWPPGGGAGNNSAGAAGLPGHASQGQHQHHHQQHQQQNPHSSRAGAGPPQSIDPGSAHFLLQSHAAAVAAANSQNAAAAAAAASQNLFYQPYSHPYGHHHPQPQHPSLGNVFWQQQQQGASSAASSTAAGGGSGADLQSSAGSSYKQPGAWAAAESMLSHKMSHPDQQAQFDLSQLHSATNGYHHQQQHPHQQQHHHHQQFSGLDHPAAMLAPSMSATLAAPNSAVPATAVPIPPQQQRLERAPGSQTAGQQQAPLHLQMAKQCGLNGAAASGGQTSDIWTSATSGDHQHGGGNSSNGRPNSTSYAKAAKVHQGRPGGGLSSASVGPNGGCYGNSMTLPSSYMSGQQRQGGYNGKAGGCSGSNNSSSNNVVTNGFSSGGCSKNSGGNWGGNSPPGSLAGGTNGGSKMGGNWRQPSKWGQPDNARSGSWSDSYQQQSGQCSSAAATGNNSAIPGQQQQNSSVEQVLRAAEAQMVEIRAQINNPRALDLLQQRIQDRSGATRFFVIKSYSEDDIHRSIKYQIWCSTKEGNKRLNDAYQESQKKGGHVMLLFSVNGSGHFCGVAEMTSAVDFSALTRVWCQDKWRGKFSVRWLLVKDVPNTQLRHIVTRVRRGPDDQANQQQDGGGGVPSTENKPITNVRDATELLPPAGPGDVSPSAASGGNKEDPGCQALSVIMDSRSPMSIFDDFLYYEKREHQIDDN